MFFVSMLLNEIIAWMRAQPGTSSLRAILYMDEIFGYMPPVANPPTKTSVPHVAEAGPRLRPRAGARDAEPGRPRLQGALEHRHLVHRPPADGARQGPGHGGARRRRAGGDFDRQQMEQTLAGLGKRRFLLHNVHEDEPVVFDTRWVMSYLAGPLTRDQIRTLMDGDRPAQPARSTPGPAKSGCKSARTPLRCRRPSTSTWCRAGGRE